MGWLRWTGFVFARTAEVLLVGVGLFYVFGGEEDSLGALAAWDLLALLYVTAGFVVVRRLRTADTPPAALELPRWFPGRLFNSCFSASASLIGVTSAVITILYKDDDDLKFYGGLAMVLSWLLLHIGYARAYSWTDQHRQGLVFPATTPAGQIEYLYFSFTIGTTFAVSDVEVTTRRMRWQVMTHSVLSYFYNAVIIALAIGLLKQ